MTPGFFTKARRPRGVRLTLDGHAITVMVKARVTDSDGREVNGTWDPENLRIEVRDLEPRSLLREALLHELVHAIHSLRDLSFPSAKVEETYTANFSAALNGLLAQTGIR